jgi:hypothetical protein
MKMEPVTQLDRYGCGVACVAFVLGVSYQEARKLFKEERIVSAKTYCFDITRALLVKKVTYKYSKLTSGNLQLSQQKGAIVFVRKNKDIYPMGHYLVRTDNGWMDPWFNREDSDDIGKAKAGYRKRLRDEATWVIYPC